MNNHMKNKTNFKSQEDFLFDLTEQYKDASDYELLDAMIRKIFHEEIFVSSSFGAESIVLLHMVSQIDKNVPIFFLNTGHLFPETIKYKETIIQQLDLTNVQIITPDSIHLENADKDGTLWHRDNDYCCHLRKVLPLEKASKSYKAWITGRKRFQSQNRSNMQKIELNKIGQFKINPLYKWDTKNILNYIEKLNLPPHPLVKKGYPSIGCLHCTNSISGDEHTRAGRWSGQTKNECGIHS